MDGDGGWYWGSIGVVLGWYSGVIGVVLGWYLMEPQVIIGRDRVGGRVPHHLHLEHDVPGGGC